MFIGIATLTGHPELGGQHFDLGNEEPRGELVDQIGSVAWS